jgi:hypothetical protein
MKILKIVTAFLLVLSTLFHASEDIKQNNTQKIKWDEKNKTFEGGFYTDIQEFSAKIGCEYLALYKKYEKDIKSLESDLEDTKEDLKKLEIECKLIYLKKKIKSTYERFEKISAFPNSFSEFLKKVEVLCIFSRYNQVSSIGDEELRSFSLDKCSFFNKDILNKKDKRYIDDCDFVLNFFEEKSAQFLFNKDYKCNFGEVLYRNLDADKAHRNYFKKMVKNEEIYNFYKKFSIFLGNFCKIVAKDCGLKSMKWNGKVFNDGEYSNIDFKKYYK